MAADRNPHHRFLAEAREHLASLTTAIVALERGDANPNEQVAQILRSTHSFKGGAGFSGLTTIEQLAHAMETVVEHIRDGRIAHDAAVIDTLLFALDRISALVDDVDHSQAADISAPLARLQQILPSGPEQNGLSNISPIPPLVPGKTAAESGSLAAPSEFPLSPQVLSAWQRQDAFLYGIKLDWFECERQFGLAPLEVARRIEHGGTVLDSRIEVSGPPPSGGLPHAPLWYWAIVSSALGPEPFARQLDIPCAAILRLESVANRARTEPKPAAPAAGRAPPGAGSLRIPVSLIDEMMSLAGELVLVRNQAKTSGNADAAQRRQLLRRLDALTNEMQGAALRLRMQPVGTLFDKYPRLVRDLARQLGKQIELGLVGADVELDKTVLESLADPLTHLVRNCCDHGIEMPDQRERTGKSPAGRIRLAARQERGQIIIQIRDDGRGLDLAAIKRKALQQGIKQQAELDQLSERQVCELILRSGFSTASHVTDLSGRGVGMDVVRSNLEQIGGVVEIDSIAGEGATFTLRLPLTLAILPCLLLLGGDQRFAIPLRDIEEIVLLKPGDTKARIDCADNEEVLRLRGQLVPVTRLREVLRRREPFSAATRAELIARHHGPERPAPSMSYVAIVRSGSQRFGLLVDGVLGSEDIVVKPLHPLLRPLGIYGAATILGDGSVALILSSEGVARHAGISHRSLTAERPQLPGPAEMRDSAKVLLFRYGPAELLAVPLEDVRRIVAIRAEQIERVGDRELISIDRSPINVLRADRFLKLSSCEPSRSRYLIMPRDARAPAGFLASEIVDTPTLDVQLDEQAYRADGVLGSAPIRGHLAILLDFHRLIEMWTLENSAARAALPAVGRRRILIVEDTEFFRRLEASYLEREGHEVVVAGHGREGVEKLETGPFDLIVSDIEMPVMDGLTLAREIRKDLRYESLPMLALTSLSGEADRRAARDAGFDAFEVKLNRQTFLEAVRALLAGGRASAREAGMLPHA